MSITKRTALITAATAAATIAASGIAYAYWTTNGTGNATATAGNALGVTAVAVPSSSGTLYPNNSVPTVVNIANPNPFPVKVSRVVLTASSAPTVSGGGAGCTAAASLVSLSSADSGVLASPVTLAANGGTGTVTVGSIAMGLASHNDCQGATFAFSGAGLIAVTAAAG